MEKKSRRSFLANTVFSVAALAGFAPFLSKGLKKNTSNEGMFVHHVFFWLKNPDSSKERKKLLEGIKTLKGIETIRQSHIGVPAGTDRPVIENGYDFSLLLMFDNLEDQNIYQEHPIHLKFIDENSQLWSKVIVYDSVDA